MEVCFFDVTATTGTDPYWRTRSLHGALPILGGAADGHQVGALVPGDGVRRGGAAFGLADAGEQALVQHHVHEFVHAGRGRGARGADDLFADRIARADIIDDAALELDGQWLALGQPVGASLVRGFAAGGLQVGRSACRVEVFLSVWISVVSVPQKKK